MSNLLEVVCPATALIDRADTRFPNIAAAMLELDVNVLLEDGSKVLLGWIGISSEGHISHIVCSPRFDSIGQLEIFCEVNAMRYVDAALLLERQGAYLSPTQWWWNNTTTV